MTCPTHTPDRACTHCARDWIERITYTDTENQT